LERRVYGVSCSNVSIARKQDKNLPHKTGIVSYAVFFCGFACIFGLAIYTKCTIFLHPLDFLTENSYYLSVNVLYVTSCNADYCGVHILFVKEELQKSTKRRKSYGWQ